MIKLFLLFLFLFISVEVYADTEALKRADKYMQGGTQSDTFRAYNDYKNLYLRSIIDDDTSLKMDALKGIIESGNKLNIDVAKYSSELQSLTLKGGYHQPEPKPMKKTKQIENVHVGALHKLKSVGWREETLLLTFDQKLGSKQIDYFTLHDEAKKRYRYVFDIKTAMFTSSQNINKNDISDIKIAQFSPSTLRLVIENSSSVSVSHEINSEVLEIKLVTASYEPTEVADKAVPPRKDRDKTIVIDPGHGGNDPGAVGYKKYREKAVVFNVSKELSKILKSRGYKVLMTRESDKFVKLRSRTEFANDKKADIFVSIHANAVPNGNANDVHGIECYFLSPSRSERAKKAAAQENSADMSDMNMYGKDSYLNLLNHHNILASNKLAIDLQRGMLGSLNQKYRDVRDGGVREGPFWVLVGAQMPSVLVEVGFISHPKEAQRLVDDEYIKNMSRGLADGIERYF
ncbi:MAG: N-acetylmuramoyl-L-alanine amidase, partial [Campylobacterota bacterium]|nr:N-acetylmuramoyl-L-alanine amidase [Campylobacterota bacterium]